MDDASDLIGDVSNLEYYDDPREPDSVPPFEVATAEGSERICTRAGLLQGPLVRVRGRRCKVISWTKQDGQWYPYVETEPVQESITGLPLKQIRFHARIEDLVLL